MPGPFQPKFVDLVRNTTTTVGTGNFTLGPAVAGYRSLATALQVGDSFYYSAIGLDKPAETEVGRGTMLPGGVMSRAALIGTNTNFSSGTKSVALIASSEWYQQAHQLIANTSGYGQSLAGAPTAAAARATLGLGSAGQESVSRFPVTLADRPSLAAYSASSAAYLREAGREGLFVWDPSNQSSKVAADAAQGIYVPAAADASGASGAWVRKYSGAVSVRWFGATGDGTTNDGGAFAAAIAYLKATAGNQNGVYNASQRLFVPAGHYFLGTTTLDIAHTLIIEGDGTGMAGAAYATKLRWADSTTGIRVQRYDTSGAATVDNVNIHAGGDGTILRGLQLYGGYSGTEGEFHGVHAKARIALENCRIENFPGDGLYALCSAGTATSSEGNANISRVIGCSIGGCRNGLHVSGSDTNIWTIINLDASSNRQWGVWDASFLGNSYFGCHAEANGWINGVPPCLVSYSGNRYCVKKDQGAAASTNAPSGTTADNAWWYYVGPGGALPTININNWANGTSYRDGGAYRSDGGGNANNLFSGCYIEGGQGFAQIDAPAFVSGGSMRPNVRGVGMVYGSGFQGKSIAVDGGIIATGGLTAAGGQFDVGPTSGSAADLVFDFNTTNTVQCFFNRYNSDGSLAASDGYLSNFFGASVLNGRSAAKLRCNGSDIASADSTGLTVTGLVSATSAILSSGGGIGYGTGAGGSVTQATSKSTGVTLNKLCGQITMSGASLAANTGVAFTVTNNQVAATDTIDLVLTSGNAGPGTYSYQVDKVAGGSFVIWVKNISGGSLSEALVFNFSVKKAVAA